MIDEQMLTSTLAIEAERYPVPEHGPAAILAAAGLKERRRVSWPAKRYRALGAAGALLVLAIAVGVQRDVVGPAGNAKPASRERAGAPLALDQADRIDGVVLPPAASAPHAPDRLSAAQPTGGADVLDGAKVIKTGRVEIEVPRDDVAATIRRLVDLARANRGYVASSNAVQDDKRPSGTVTLRIPVASFESVYAELAGGKIGKVRKAGTQGQDVTGEYVDLAARIKSLDGTRAQYRTLLARAKTIGEVLSVQDKLTEVQTQIEQLQGKQRVLGDQADLASIQVDVAGPGDAPSASPHRENGFIRAVREAVGNFVRGLETIIAGLGTLLLVALVALAVALLARLGRRVAGRRMV